MPFAIARRLQSSDVGGRGRVMFDVSSFVASKSHYKSQQVTQKSLKSFFTLIFSGFSLLSTF
jgi:hypothetical protein